MIRYFNADCEGATRIAAVEGDTEDDIFEANEATRHNEIDAGDLPDDFKLWKRYTAHGYGHCTVEVLSRDGD